jgi:hypothetical protein
MGCTGQPSGAPGSGQGGAETRPSAADSGEGKSWLEHYIGLGRPDQQVCRIELLADLPSIEVVTRSRETGGATCYTGGKRLMYFPYNGSCSHSLARGQQPVLLSAEEGEQELSRCLAVANSSNPLSSKSIVMSASRPEDQESVDALSQFSVDLVGLASHGGLEVSHVATANGIICAETERPDRVVRDIERAEIVDGHLVNYEIRNESCQSASRTLTGSEWPTILGIKK